MNRAAEEAKEAAGNRDGSAFAEALSNGRRAQKAYGVEDRRMRELPEMLANAPGTFAAKISGSGLGLGTAPADFPCPALRLAVPQDGGRVESRPVQ
ncbi:MAG: hypothetical protein IJS32_01585 [Kiritimatiellae bacterium]|nr:hypothetical protein [Kiritimatiellia bacterium]